MRPVLLLAVLAGCAAPGTELTEAHRAAIVDSVASTLAAFRDAVGAMNPDSVASFYVADTTFRWVEEGTIRYRGRGEIAAALREAAPYMHNTVLLHDGTVITPLAPGVASVVTGFAQRFTNQAGETGGFAGALTAVMVHREGRWQFLAGHASSADAPRTSD